MEKIKKRQNNVKEIVYSLRDGITFKNISAFISWVYQERNLLHNGGSIKKSYVFHPTHPFSKKK